MFITKKHLSRRAALKGLGITLGLPLLDSMVPAQTPLAKTAANPQIRLGFCYIPHGGVMMNWTPVKEGTDFKLSRTLMPLQNVRDRVTVISNLAHKQAAGIPGDGGGDHGRSPAVWLNGTRPRRTEGEDVRAGITIDQIAAQKIGQDTPLPSLELATEDTSGLLGACDVGFSCTYMNTISWRTPTSPLPMEINPRGVFDRLFGDGASAEERLVRIERERSILDAVTGQVKSLSGGLGSNDRSKVSEYLENIREIERRIQLAEKQNSNQNINVPSAPIGIPDDHQEHSHLMLDLMALAFQADITRISTFMMAREVSYRTFNNIGIPDAFHPTSHHQNDPEKLERLTRINTYHVGLIARLMEKLKSIPDGEGTLLDHSMLIYGSCMSNSNVHNHSPLPVFVGGGGCGQIKGGRHIKLPDETPMANLLSTALDIAGVRQGLVGDATGLLSL
jgi:hypothetical protein